MKSFLASAAVAAVLAASGAANATTTTLKWTFSGTNDGSGQLTYNTSNGLVSAFSGSYDGQAITRFWDASTPPVLANDPSAGLMTYHGVPNTGGADYIFDDLYPIDYQGILVSVGASPDQRFYDISLDSPGASQVDFFSINPNGSYRPDNGTFTTTAVPETSTWAMLGLGFAALSFAGYRKARTPRALSF
jgi:hypothetical protein